MVRGGVHVDLFSTTLLNNHADIAVVHPSLGPDEVRWLALRHMTSIHMIFPDHHGVRIDARRCQMQHVVDGVMVSGDIGTVEWCLVQRIHFTHHIEV